MRRPRGEQFALSIVVDLLIMGCLIAHEVLGWERRPAPAVRGAAAPVAPVAVLPPPRVEKSKPVLVASSPAPCRVADALKGLKVGGRSRLELMTVRQLYVADANGAAVNLSTAMHSQTTCSRGARRAVSCSRMWMARCFLLACVS